MKFSIHRHPKAKVDTHTTRRAIGMEAISNTMLKESMSRTGAWMLSICHKMDKYSYCVNEETSERYNNESKQKKESSRNFQKRNKESIVKY